MDGEATMKNHPATAKRRSSSILLWACLIAAPLGVQADTVTRPVVFDLRLGELSPGTEAPTPDHMVSAIRGASAGALTATLEYGERVECMACVPLLEGKLLASSDPKVREIAAWWLRQRVFGYGRAAVAMRKAVEGDRDPVHRARAAEALGEFQDVRGLPSLKKAVMEDAVVAVRVAAVRALGRLNAQSGHAVLAAALQDDAASVRRAALEQVPRLSFFAAFDAVRARLTDDDAGVRLRAAQLAGELRIDAAEGALSDLLRHDDAAVVRQAAAWALGRLGGSPAKTVIRDARAVEQDPGVLDALEVAQAMTR
jgi:HEAT repeat protein